MAKRGFKVVGVSYRLHITPGVFNESLVKVADNSGAQLARVIGVLHRKTVWRRVPGAGVGDVVVVSIRAGKPELRKQVMHAIVTVSYTHLTLPTRLRCRSRWSPYH